MRSTVTESDSVFAYAAPHFGSGREFSLSSQAQPDPQSRAYVVALGRRATWRKPAGGCRGPRRWGAKKRLPSLSVAATAGALDAPTITRAVKRSNVWASSGTSCAKVGILEVGERSASSSGPRTGSGWSRQQISRTDSTMARHLPQPDAPRSCSEPHGGEKQPWQDCVCGFITTRRIAERADRGSDDQADCRPSLPLWNTRTATPSPPLSSVVPSRNRCCASHE